MAVTPAPVTDAAAGTAPVGVFPRVGGRPEPCQVATAVVVSSWETSIGRVLFDAASSSLYGFSGDGAGDGPPNISCLPTNKAPSLGRRVRASAGPGLGCSLNPSNRPIRTLAMRPHLRSILACSAAVSVVVGLAGCGSSTKKNAATPATSALAPSASAAPASTGSLTIKSFAFTPTPLSAKTGATITITNNDTTDHTVTDSGGAFDTGHIASGTSKTITVTKAGTYAYHCNIHQFMKGVLQVAT
jgi:plastocyanin